MRKIGRQKLDVRGGRIELAHGAGGAAMAQLIKEIFHAAFDNEWLRREDDQAVFETREGRMAIATDSFVVSPLFFPGGDIGALAVNGTVNDVALAGARPLYLTASFILEEGLPLSDLKRIAESMGHAARNAGVEIITGDTKVVERGKADGVFITTTGVGLIDGALQLSADKARPGDRVILSGSIGDHGCAILSVRENLSFETEIVSDQAALHGLIAAIVAASGFGLRVMRDPTRGGLAATLNEIAGRSAVGFHIDERAIVIKPGVAAACEILGLDPLYIANEGKLVAIISPESSDAVLQAMRTHPLGREASIIGEVVDDAREFVQMTTKLGGRRIVDRLSGEQLPRIC